jgi:hypothetical protein
MKATLVNALRFMGAAAVPVSPPVPAGAPPAEIVPTR